MSKKKNTKSNLSATIPMHGKKMSLSVVLPEGVELQEHLKGYSDKVDFVRDVNDAKNELICFPSQSELETSGKLDTIIDALQRSVLSSDTVFVPKLPSPTAKEGFAKRAGFWFQGVIERLYNGIEAHHCLYSCILFPTEKLKDIFLSIPAFSKLSPLALARECGRNGLSVQGLDVSGLQVRKKTGILEIIKGIGLFCKLVKEEFVSTPLKHGFAVKEAITNGNSLIYRFKFFVLAIVGLLSMLFISKDYNVTWDEETNQQSAELVYNYLSSLGSDTTMFNFSEGRNRYTNQHYGISFDVMAVVAQKIIHNFDSNANIYAIRHSLNSIVGFLVILFTGLLAWRLMDTRAGVLALLIMYFSPSFFGHSFNNPKDIPFALGFIMSVYYLARTLLEFPKPTLQSRLMLAISLGVVLSVRAGGLMSFAFVVLFFRLYWLLNLKQSNAIKPFLKYGLPILLIGYLLGISIWPYALRDPLNGVLNALRKFENFSDLTYYELFDGARMYIKPWYYIPKFILITAPLMMLMGLPLAFLYYSKGGLTKTQKLVLGLVLFSSVFPVAYTIYKGSYLYNGWRHMLFVYPGLVVLSALGWSKLIQFVKSISLKWVTLLAFVGFSIPSMIWSFANHPYQYMYFNEIVGGVKGANGNYELDYWNQTPRAAMEWIGKNIPELFDGKIPVNSNNPIETLTTFVKGSDSIQYRWTREYEWTKNNWQYAIWTSRTLNKNQIRGGYWPPVGTVYTVDVAGVPVCAVVKRKAQTGYDGHRAFSEKKYDSAVFYFTEAIKAEPLEEEYHRGLGASFRVLGRFNDAITEFKKSLEIRDGNYEAYFSLGDIYFTQATSNEQNIDQAMLARAEGLFKEAIKYKKNYTAAYMYLGVLSMNKNDMNQAMYSYRSMIESNPNIAQGYQGVARVFINLQQTDSALYYLNYAMQLAPNQADVYADISRAFELRGDKQNAEKYRQEFYRLQAGGQQ